MQECSPKHSRMGTARTKEDKDTVKEGNQEKNLERWQAYDYSLTDDTPFQIIDSRTIQPML